MTAQFTTLATFNGTNGSLLYAGLTADANGDLFGTTEAGGAYNAGTVFEMKNIGTVAAPVYASAPTTLVNFNGSNGASPYAGLIADAVGDLFGTTEAGGANNFGTVFEIQNIGTVAAPVYAAPTTLVNFNSSNGATPYAGLTADANGNLFGTTYYGIAYTYGTVFEIQNTGTVAAPVYASAPTTLVSFNYSDGAYPYFAGLTVDANGNLFGTTPNGGGLNYGTVFEIQNIGTVTAPVYASAPTTLVSFNDSNGADPNAGLIVDANGNLFGTTEGDGYTSGTVFEIQNTGTVAAPIYASAPTTLVTFNGSNAVAGLLADANGNLFGTSSGTAFEMKNTGTVAAPVYTSAPITLASFGSTYADRRRQRQPVRHDDPGCLPRSLRGRNGIRDHRRWPYSASGDCGHCRGSDDDLGSAGDTFQGRDHRGFKLRGDRYADDHPRRRGRDAR